MYHMAPVVCSRKFTLGPTAWDTRVVSYTPFPASQSLFYLPVSFPDHQGAALPLTGYFLMSSARGGGRVGRA